MCVCGGVPAPSRSPLSFPAGFSPPQIYLEGDTVAGKETRVTCDVSARVAPPDPPDLRLTLTGGGLPPSTQRGSRLGLVFTARPEQHGREVTCEATLRLGGRTLNASTAATLWVWGEFGGHRGGGGTGQTWVENSLPPHPLGWNYPPSSWERRCRRCHLWVPRGDGGLRHHCGEEKGHPTRCWVPLPCPPRL